MPELILAGVTIVSLTALILWLVKKVRELQQQVKDLEASPSNWRFFPSPQSTAEESQRAEKTLYQAEIAAGHIASEKQQEIEIFEKEYRARLDTIINQFQTTLQQTLQNVGQSLSNNVTSAQKQHSDFLAQTQKQTLEWQDDVETEVKNKINTFLENFEENMAQFFMKSEERSLGSINLELKSARSLIDSYKSQQLSIIEENIVAVLERTLSIVLKQKLSLKDQVDLVYEALEKAKIEKFLV